MIYYIAHFERITMSQEYRNPPIEEAICEFRYAPETPLDLTIPGLLYDLIKSDFPKKQDLQLREKEYDQPVATAARPRDREDLRAVFVTADETTLVEVGEQLIAIHCFSPYPTWAVFSGQIRTVIEALTSITDMPAFDSIELRYLNRIRIASLNVELEEYFEFLPSLGQRLPQQVLSFFVGAIVPLKDDANQCKIQLTNRPPDQENESLFILDLTVRPSEKPFPADKVNDWIDQAHTQIVEVFEGCITDDLRKVLNRTET